MMFRVELVREDEWKLFLCCFSMDCWRKSREALEETEKLE